MAPESIKGKMSYSIGDQDQAMQWNAKRFDPMNAATGKWTLEFVTPDDLEVSFTIKVQKKGKGLSVDFVDDDSVDVSHVKFKKNVLSFDSEQVYQGIPVTVEWDVKLDDDLVDGVLYYSFDNEQGEGELTVTGERVD